VAKKTRNAKAGGTKSRQGSSSSSQRRVIVFGSLLAVMTATSALLLALAPAPLTAGAASSLFAVGTPDSLDAIFQTSAPMEKGHWRHVYIHHSQTDSGSAATLGESHFGLADHFVIGNGDGCGDGEVQIAQRWQRQTAAGQVPGLASINDRCVSICLIGDFTHARPTPTQVLRLTQLLTALQSRCEIPASEVHFFGTDTGVGPHFPAAAVKEQLLP
jgi:hypothetical protein